MSRKFGELRNCPGCRRACPVDQLTCANGKGIFADMEADRLKAERTKNQPTRSFFPETEARVAAEKDK